MVLILRILQISIGGIISNIFAAQTFLFHCRAYFSGYIFGIDVIYHIFQRSTQFIARHQ